eukprot:g1383.t1
MGPLDLLVEQLMQSIIYDVAVSIDGYIAGHNGDVSKFAHEGDVVDDYFARLSDYSVAVMGRNTYEFGYRFGLKPGMNPYPHMKTVVFSTSIELPEEADVEVVRSAGLDSLKALKAAAEGPIYLCGGGEFAGAALAEGLLDIIRLKRAPVLLGGGVSLFGSRSPTAVDLSNTLTRPYEGGYLFQEFSVKR